jgi:hypothetical protein
MNRRPAVRLVALAAAYALAFGMLMPIFAAMALSAGGADAAAICSGTGAPGDAIPADPGMPVKPACPCDVCTMPACAGTPVRLDVVPFVHALRANPISAGLNRVSPARPALRLDGGNFARGPPSA